MARPSGRPANSAHQCITGESRRSRSRRDDYDEGSTTVLLRDYPWYVVPARLHKMRAPGQYRKATLIERYGPYRNMVDLRLQLAAGCPRIAAGRVMDLS